MSTPTPTRRTVLARTAAAVTAGGAAAVGVGYATSGAAVAVEADDEFLASDVRVERTDGALDAVTVAPELRVAWRDFGGGLDGIDVTLSAALEDVPGFDVLYDARAGKSDAIAVDGSIEPVDGAVELAFDRLDLTAVGDDVTTADFGGDLAPGESATTTVELTLRVDVVGAQDEVVTAFETVTFDVTVHNPEGEASATGRANTGAA